MKLLNMERVPFFGNDVELEEFCWIRACSVENLSLFLCVQDSNTHFTPARCAELEESFFFIDQ